MKLTKNLYSRLIIVILTTCIIGYIIVQAATTYYTDLPTVSSGSTLTATNWNNLVNYANKAVKQDTEVLTVTGGKVGIGIITPSERLDLWGGNIKMGYEIVQTDVPAWSAVTWYFANCPVGKVVLGGSCSTWSGIDPTNTSISGNSYGCYKGVMTTNYQIKAICANMK